MFRVSISSDLAVFASKVFSSSAQVRLGASASSAPELAHSVPNSTPAPCRNSRRLSAGVASPTTRMGCVNMVVSSLRNGSARKSASRIVAVTLQHLDLVCRLLLEQHTYKTGLILPMLTLFSRTIQIDLSFHAALGVIVILAIA